MAMFLWLLTMLLLLWVAYEDFRSREITVWPIPVIFLLGILKIVLHHSEGIQLRDTGLNLLFLILQFLLLTIYCSVKSGKVINPVSADWIGMGDVLILLALSSHFAFWDFLLFNIIGLSGMLLVYLGIVFLLKKPGFQRIPLAGGLCLLLFFFSLVKGF